MTERATSTVVQQSGSLHSQAPALGERRLRRVGAWILLYLALQAELGLAWDRNWHDLIGRDQFWTLPHTMLYLGVGGAGLIAIVVVLADTWRYYKKKPGVDDDSTIDFLRFFHAPLGYILLGFGALTDLLAAPLDNYWHLLYGIDVTLWSPFHIMGTIGGLLIELGMLYIFASEIVIERQTAHLPRRLLGFSALEWGLLSILAASINLTLPALTAFIPITIGPLQVYTYAFALTLAGTFSLVSAIQITRKAGAALLLVALLSIESLYTQAYVPFAIRTSVDWLGLSYRFVDRRPAFNLTLALIPLLFLLPALLMGWLAARNKRKDNQNILPGAWLLALLMAIPTVVFPSIIASFVDILPGFSLPAGMFALQASWLDMLVALPFTFLIGMAAVVCGKVLGDIWYMNRR